jgi:hypothetical protein
MEIDDNGTHRFKENKIVNYLLEKGGLSLNDLAVVDGPEGDAYHGGFPREDWVQFAQLIGYSVSGWGGLSYVNDEDYEAAQSVHGDEDVTADAARVEFLSARLAEIREGLREPVAKLYECCPEDLGGDL